jgi:hypothetical protein
MIFTIIFFTILIILGNVLFWGTIPKKVDYSFKKNKKKKYDAEFFINEKGEFIIFLNGYFKTPLEGFFVSYFEENKYMSINDNGFNNPSFLSCGNKGRLLTKSIKYKKLKIYDLKRISDDLVLQRTKVCEDLGNGYMRESKALFRVYEK